MTATPTPLRTCATCAHTLHPNPAACAECSPPACEGWKAAAPGAPMHMVGPLRLDDTEHPDNPTYCSGFHAGWWLGVAEGTVIGTVLVSVAVTWGHHSGMLP